MESSPPIAAGFAFFFLLFSSPTQGTQDTGSSTPYYSPVSNGERGVFQSLNIYSLFVIYKTSCRGNPLGEEPFCFVFYRLQCKK